MIIARFARVSVAAAFLLIAAYVLGFSVNILEFWPTMKLLLLGWAYCAGYTLVEDVVFGRPTLSDIRNSRETQGKAAKAAKTSPDVAG